MSSVPETRYAKSGDTYIAYQVMGEGPFDLVFVFSATYPQRTSALILYGSSARFAWAPDNPWGRTDEQMAAGSKWVEENWGQCDSVDIYSPSLAGDAELRKFVGRLERASASPGAANTLRLMNYGIDVRHVLPTVGVPTLVLHRTGDLPVNVEHGRYLARHVKGAKYVELPGIDHNPWVGDAKAILGEIEAFLTGGRSETEPDLDRVLASVLFTDIVEATTRVIELGDRAWKDLRLSITYLSASNSGGTAVEKSTRRAMVFWRLLMVRHVLSAALRRLPTP